jgi:hypothetical protein
MDESEKLWKYTVQLRKIAEHREADAEDEIRSEYLGVLEKLQAIIAKYYAKYGDSETGVMTHGDLRAVGQYKVFLQDVIDNLDGVSKPVDKAIRQAIEDTYTTCYNGFSDAVKLSESDNKPLSTLLSGLQSTTPETVKNIVENPMDKLTLSKILSRRRSKIVSETKKTLAVGLANGDSYTRMAQRISDTLNGDFKKAMRIVRTESNRAINRGFQDVSEDAAELLLGSDYVEVKEWCSMEDELVRSTHSHLNGKIIHVLDSFESGGAKAKCPGTFGVAAEDINCRCFLDYSFVDRDEFIAQGGVIPDEILGKEVDISGESGIIKAITVSDIDVADEDGVISDECRQTIADTIKQAKMQGSYFSFDEVRIVDIPKNSDGSSDIMRTNAVDKAGNPYTVLEINRNRFAGKSLEDVDRMFKIAENTTCNSLSDAVIHECGHARTIYDRTYANYERINEELSGGKFTEPIKGRNDGKSLHDLAGSISKLAQKDGLECIAECGVKLNRGETIPKELKDIYDDYTSGGG